MNLKIVPDPSTKKGLEFMITVVNNMHKKMHQTEKVLINLLTLAHIDGAEVTVIIPVIHMFFKVIYISSLKLKS